MPAVKGSKLNTPVLLIIFNRPDTTAKVFEAIRKAAPSRLYLAADAPRAGKEGEAEKCAEAKAIALKVDWECEVKTLFRNENLGCSLGPCTAIDWFFEHEEQGIIFEDDCLASPSFFTFCEELLEYYKNDERVMHIGGVNFQEGNQRGHGSYYYSRFTHGWGWASWRRAWKHFDVRLLKYVEAKKSGLLENVLDNRAEIMYWDEVFSRIYEKKLKTVWDYQWNFAVWSQHGLCIVPNTNLVTNIGFGLDGTHTLNSGHKFANMPAGKIEQIIHPNIMMQDKTADQYTQKQMQGNPISVFITRILSLLGKK